MRLKWTALSPDRRLKEPCDRWMGIATGSYRHSRPDLRINIYADHADVWWRPKGMHSSINDTKFTKVAITDWDGLEARRLAMRWLSQQIGESVLEYDPAEDLRPVRVHPRTKEVMAEIGMLEYPDDDLEVGEPRKPLEYHLDGIEHALSSGYRFWVGPPSPTPTAPAGSKLEVNYSDMTDAVQAMYDKLVERPSVGVKIVEDERVPDGMAIPSTLFAEPELDPDGAKFIADLELMVEAMKMRAKSLTQTARLTQARIETLEREKKAFDAHVASEQLAIREGWTSLDAERETFAELQNRWYGVVEDELGTLATPAELASALLRLTQTMTKEEDHA